MIVCFNCGKEMKCVKTGIGVRYGTSHVYAGDAFECVCCKIKIINTNSNAFNDPQNVYPTVQGHEQNEQCEFCFRKKHPYIGDAPCGEVYLPDNRV